MSARLTVTGSPPMSLPRATVSGWRSSSLPVLPRMSPRVTSSRSRLGTSMPIADLPGMGAMMRTSGEASA